MTIILYQQMQMNLWLIYKLDIKNLYKIEKNGDGLQILLFLLNQQNQKLEIMQMKMVNGYVQDLQDLMGMFTKNGIKLLRENL